MSGVKEEHIELAALSIVGFGPLQLKKYLVQMSSSPSTCKILKALLNQTFLQLLDEASSIKVLLDANI
jgi:hypothetical protein